MTASCHMKEQIVQEVTIESQPGHQLTVKYFNELTDQDEAMVVATVDYEDLYAALTQLMIFRDLEWGD